MSNLRARKDFVEDEGSKNQKLGKKVDEIIEEAYYEYSVDENGNGIATRKTQKINVTKQLAETMTTLKIETLDEKLKQIRKE